MGLRKSVRAARASPGSARYRAGRPHKPGKRCERRRSLRTSSRAAKLSHDLLAAQIQPPASLRLHLLTVPEHRVVLAPPPLRYPAGVIAAPRVTRLPRRQRTTAVVEVREVDDLAPARRKAVDVVAVIRDVGRLPHCVRIASHRHRAAVENAVQPPHFAQRMSEVLLVQPAPPPT